MKRAHLLARVLVGFGGALAQQVHAAMDVRVVVRVVVDERVDDRLRLLAGGGVVEINQRLAVNLFPENREIFPDPLHIESGSRAAQ